MNKFYSMLERANLQFVGEMIQMGSRKTRLDPKNLEERENEAVRTLEKRLENIIQEKDRGEVTDIAMEYANDCCEIYFTVGMKAGAKLMFQLLNDSLRDN